MRFLFKALLAATTLMPVATAAGAQDAPRDRGDRPRGDWGQRGEGPRGDRPDMRQAPDRPQRIDVDRDMARGGDRIVDRDGSPVGPRPGADRGPDARGGVRIDAGAGFAPGGRPDRDAGWRDDRDVGRRPGARADVGAGWRGDVARDDPRRDTRPAPGFLGAPDRRGYAQGGGWNQGGWGQQGGWRNDDRGNDARGWNRGWRAENRYDWTRYRIANRGAYRLPRYYAPYGWNGGYRRFSVGVTLGAGLFGENYWIDDPYAYRLPEAYGPYRWVRYYNDALLVDIRYGRVVDVVNDIFW